MICTISMAVKEDHYKHSGVRQVGLSGLSYGFVRHTLGSDGPVRSVCHPPVLL